MKTPEEDLQAMEAAKLYAGKATFQAIADQLTVSKSYAQALVRRGIALSITEPEKSNPGELSRENPGTHPSGGIISHNTEIPSLSFPQDPRTGPYMLETIGIQRRVMLTPKDIMIFDLWKGAGFEGDMSDFISDAINYLYDTKRPTERRF